MASTGKDVFDKLDITEEEISKITEALKDEKFRKMFVEYAEEISDPENRKLYEQEIAQLENERGMDIQFIHPKPGHVLKTNVDGEKKAFINICQNDKVGKPSSEKKIGANGVSGLNWSIPHSQTPPREDLDKGGKTCMVYDVVFHPDTYRMGESNDRFKKMVEDTALDGVEKQFGVKLDRKNIKRPKLGYKGVPVASVLRTRQGDSDVKQPDENNPLVNMPYPYGNKTSAEKAKEMAAAVKEKEGKKKSGEKSTKRNDKADVAEPKYSIIHRSDMDIQEFRNAPDARSNTRPKELVVKIELPLLKSASQANLDIFEQKLLLESSTPAAYKLDIKLPYPVDDEQGSAKFDKAKRCLIVTLPVLPAENVKMPSFIEEMSNGDISHSQNGGSENTTTVNGHEQNTSPPLIQEISEQVNELEHQTGDEKSEPKVIHKPHILYSLPDFTYNQDGETVSFVLNVKKVASDSISKTFSSPNVCDLKFLSIGSGGFPVHYRIIFKFEEECRIVAEHSSVDVGEMNMVLVLLKDKKCRGVWNRFEAGLKEDLQEYLFVTEDNIKMELEKLEEDGVKCTNEDQSCDQDSSTVQVTEMTQKKLTIEIKPKRKKATFLVGDEPIDIENEADIEDAPSSAEIEVVHEKRLPNLHGILKQRSMSESSDDYCSSFNGSCSPGSPRDDGLRKSVSFNDKVDSTTFKPGASVTTMTQCLKSKRRRNRKKDEKRRRHNSGSEGSSGDDQDQKYASDSHSEGNDSDHGCDENKNGAKEGKTPKTKSKQSKRKKGKNDNKGDSKEDAVLHDLIEEDDNVDDDDDVCPELEDFPDNEVEISDLIGAEEDLECPELEEIPVEDKNDDIMKGFEMASHVENGENDSESVEKELSEKVKNKLNIPKKEGKCDSDDDDDNDDELRTSVSNVENLEKVEIVQTERKERTSNGSTQIVNSSQKNGENDGNLKIGNGEPTTKSDEKMSGNDSGVECGGDTLQTEEESKVSAVSNHHGDASLNWNDGVNSQEHRTQCAFTFTNSLVYDLDVE